MVGNAFKLNDPDQLVDELDAMRAMATGYARDFGEKEQYDVAMIAGMVADLAAIIGMVAALNAYDDAKR